MDHDTWLLIAKIVGTLAYMFLERWLGRTDKVEASSVLDVVFRGVGSIMTKLTTKK